MRSQSFTRRAILLAATGIAGLALTFGGVQKVSAGEIDLTPTNVVNAATPTITIPNELVIAAERTAGICTNGICPLTGCVLNTGALSCAGALQTCHVSVGGSCVPPSATTTTSTDSIDSPGGCAEGPNAQICNHQDPTNTGCSGDGVTNQEVFDGSAPNGDQVFTDNRWSNKCQSNWARTFENGNYGQTLDAGVDYPDGSNSDYQTYNGNYMWSGLLWGGSGSQPVCAWGSGSATDGTGVTQCY